MKSTDKKVLQQLRTNARDSITNISKRTGIPTSTVFLKIKDHENSVIKKHTSLLDYSRLGFNQWQEIAIKLAEDCNREFEQYLLEHENVNTVYQINGGYDYIIETVHRNIREYLDFVKEMESKFKIAEKEEFQIINDLKRESFMSTQK